MTNGPFQHAPELAKKITLTGEAACKINARFDELASVAGARQTIADAFKDDPNFRETYVANVAMLLHDRYGITDHETRNKAGDDIVRLIFET